MRAAQVVPLVTARALDRAFDYRVPEALEERTRPGVLVACPLGRRPVLGVVVGRDAPTHDGTLVDIAGIVDVPEVAGHLLDLAGWVSRYYAAPLASALRLVLPPGSEGVLRRRPDGTYRVGQPPAAGRRATVARLVESMDAPGARRGAIIEVLRAAGGELPAAELVRVAKTTLSTLRRMAEDGVLTLTVEEAGSTALNWFGEIDARPDLPPTLTEDQRAAVASITGRLDHGGGLLLHGVTGSGKTEVYLRAIEEERRRGRSTIVLVPEIALTPQTLRRLLARLGPRVAVWHSGLTLGERVAEDRRIRSGDVDVVLGARSAIFAPIERLGLVIVDEEHDSSYKQDQVPRYDARQVAFRRARDAGALVVYGSATPRPESWHSLERATLRTRADGARLPNIEIVDMRVQRAGPISSRLADALQDAATRGEKAILLLNRRGFSRMALCRSCGWIARCPNCDVALVHHRPPDALGCHHCGLQRPIPDVCPSCASAELMRQGTGTQGLEEALGTIVPGVRLHRLDADRAAGRGAVADILAAFAKPGAAILLGTQMVAKGHDLPGIAVAGVLEADGPLQLPDFRSEERAFGLIVQLAGRAGRRAGEDARVIVQAWEPAARAVQLGARHAVEEFLVGETERRRDRGFPPFSHLVRVVVEGERATSVAEISGEISERLEAATGSSVLGPAVLHRLRGRTRRSILVRVERAADATAPLRVILADLAPRLRSGEVRAVVDVDPQDT